MKKIVILLIFAAAAMLWLRAYAKAPAQKFDPRALTIYQVMVASFQHHPDGGEGYRAMWGPDDARKNGNIKGITAALDSIKSLGANAIWLTPIFQSEGGAGGEKLNATGYFATDFFKVDPKFGTEDDLRELVREAHARDMFVILDGVFGHHGGVTTPSPSGHTIDSTVTFSDRGEQGGSGNVSYPGSLPYFTEVATYWIDNFDIDGWRLDQAYQATQGGHNYWREMRAAVEKLTDERRARGEKWGTLGYMVGEDWGDADVINRGVYRDGGLVSAFDFAGKELISGPMQRAKGQGLEHGWADVRTVLSEPTARGYLNDKVMPNLFLTNHDGLRLADHFDPYDPHYYGYMKTRFAILAAYSGPITLYYGDEFADRTLEAEGGQPDNVGRTSGHLAARNPGEADLRAYVANAMHFRADNPAMWRGKATFTEGKLPDGGSYLIVKKTDKESGNEVLVIFSDADASIAAPGLTAPAQVKAWQPALIKLR